jgi:ABC-type lipoprotein export system ATPase subunit
MPLIEMSDYCVRPMGSGYGLNHIYFSLGQGDLCTVESQNPDDAHLFMRALATLNMPSSGTYRFNGQTIDLHSQRKSLKCKRKIGYIAPDAALISNLTIRQNLLLMQYYFSNDLSIGLDERQQWLCQSFGIDAKMNQRPAGLNAREVQAAMIIREVIKKPQLLLLIHPEDFIGHDKFELITQIFNDWIAEGKPVVFHSYDRRLIRRYAKKKVIISNGTLTTIDIKPTDETMG